MEAFAPLPFLDNGTVAMFLLALCEFVRAGWTPDHRVQNTITIIVGWRLKSELIRPALPPGMQRIEFGGPGADVEHDAQWAGMLVRVGMNGDEGGGCHW